MKTEKEGRINHHTHTSYCDGSSLPEFYIKAAILRNNRGIGFSAHAPLPVENKWSLKHQNLPEYLSEISLLQKKYAGVIDVFTALEQDYIPGISDDFTRIRENTGCHYLIGAVHLVRNPRNGELWFIDGPRPNFETGLEKVFSGDAHAGVSTYFSQLREMISSQKPDIVAHLDKIKMNNGEKYFSTRDSWYRDEIMQTLDVIQRNGCIVEINTRGIYTGRCPELYPDVEVIRECIDRGIDLTISADAHRPEEINSQFDETVELLRQNNCTKVKVYTAGGWAYRLL